MKKTLEQRADAAIATERADAATAQAAFAVDPESPYALACFRDAINSEAAAKIAVKTNAAEEYQYQRGTLRKSNSVIKC